MKLELRALAVQQPSCVFDEQPQQFKGLPPKRDLLAGRREQRTAGEVENESLESIDRIHRDGLLGALRSRRQHERL